MRKRMIMAIAAVWMLATLAPAVAAPAVQDTASMLTLPGMAEVEGSTVSLVATDSKATITVNTGDLVAGNVYTLWAFTFSSPENCVDGCGFDDVARDAAGIGFDVQQVAGHATGASDNVNFGGNIAVVNAQGAEYHIVVADHGPLDPDIMPDQIKTPSMNTVQIGFLGG
jgi:hypothetical protein